jgi:type II secretory pathway pseudopilin PulG
MSRAKEPYFMFYVPYPNKGFTLLEAVIGIGLIVIVFTALYGAFVFGVKVVGQSKAQVGAIALANQRMEQLRNFPYKNVGTLGGIPSGNIPETEIITKNVVPYTIKTTIIYIDDPFDGTVTTTDTLPADYKRAKIKVSWSVFFGGEINLITDIVPKGIETEAGGGTLIIWALNSLGQGVSRANIHIVNDQISPLVDVNYQTNDSGYFILAGAPTSTESYKVTVGKNGYSQDRTYGVEEVANPARPLLSVFERQLTEVSFSIDKLSAFSIETRGRESFDDDFGNYAKLSFYENISVSSSEATLLKIGEEYATSGELVSVEISPSNLINWSRFFWQDQRPENTEIKYHLLYATSASWELVSETDLPGNAAGFNVSPVALSNLDITDYPKLKLKGVLSATQTSATPILFDWHLVYNTPLVGNVDFCLQGSKIIGTDINENPVYKYATQQYSSDVNGKINISGIEWDSYIFSATTTTAMDLMETIPGPQPIDLLPGATTTAKLYFKAENDLLAKVNDASSSEPIFGVGVRVVNEGLGYDESKPTDEYGNAYFIPLKQATYDIEAAKDGYKVATTSVNITGKTSKIIELTAY